jgi:hypothetical protein
MARHPVAWVDEAYISKAGHPGVYLLAAVLAEGDEVEAITAAAREGAPEGGYHSTELYHRGHVGDIEAMLDVVAQHAAWTAVVAHAPLGPSGEIARQTSLRQLLTYLDRQRVRDVILDVRGSPQEWQQAREQGLKLPELNHADLRSYRHLVTNKEISPRMRLQHLDDRDQPGLWLADSVAWAARRALNADEPQWWFRVASAATILEASTGKEIRIQDNGAALPTGEYGPHSASPSARTMLLPPQEYPQATAGSYDIGRAGAFLADLIGQAAGARASQEPSSERALLLEEVRTLSQRIDDLTREVHELRAAGPAPAGPLDVSAVEPPAPRPAVEPEIE